MVVRVEAVRPSFNDALVEILCYTHPALDPDTGHFVCHHHTVGAAVIEAGGSRVPALVLGGCAYLVEGRDYASSILEGARRVSITLGSEEASGGGARGDPYWVAQALRAAAELRLAADTYAVRVGGEEWIAVALTGKQGPESLVLVPPACGEDRFQRRSQAFYQ
jgi:hypothetical protein